MKITFILEDDLIIIRKLKEAGYGRIDDAGVERVKGSLVVKIRDQVEAAFQHQFEDEVDYMIENLEESEV